MYITLTFLPSNLEQIAQLDAISEAIIKNHNFDQSMFPNILISLTEAVSNAILHGNDSDESKEVEISLNKTQEGISLKVSDEGTGFDFRSIPDPTIPENVVKQGGRGIFLIRDLSNKMNFLDNGSTIEMFFNH